MILYINDQYTQGHINSNGVTFNQQRELEKNSPNQSFTDCLLLAELTPVALAT
jgi:hypothetical protein